MDTSQDEESEGHEPMPVLSRCQPHAMWNSAQTNIALWSFPLSRIGDRGAVSLALVGWPVDHSSWKLARQLR
jgi:hypothetical protein